ncbi:MAG: YkgJ family cysteine cluster protein [Bacteroidales bacterium]|nr:YkgJ family cysteine cluster protein [Bacteroidales bacterium]
MKIETSVEKIRQIAIDRNDENRSFREFLQLQNPDDIDKIVHALDAEITPLFSCVECGVCCNNVRPIATDEEMLKFVDEDKIDELRYEPGIVCKHLDGKKCTIYADRYDHCKQFPYLDQVGFVRRFSGVLFNYELCPIVFNVVEQLKLKLEWEYKS